MRFKKLLALQLQKFVEIEDPEMSAVLVGCIHMYTTLEAIKKNDEWKNKDSSAKMALDDVELIVNNLEKELEYEQNKNKTI